MAVVREDVIKITFDVPKQEHARFALLRESGDKGDK